MLSHFATGQAVVPTVRPGEKVDVTITLDHEMANHDYVVSILKPAPLLDAGTVTVTKTTTKNVSVHILGGDVAARSFVLTVIAFQ